MAELSKVNLLRSWKEIAAHLGIDARTCYRWEDSRGATSVLDDAYKARLVEDIRYWDGSAWTPEPTPVRR
jgi:hypothetical protein